VNNELGVKWKETFVDCFKVVSRNLYVGTE